MQVPLEVSFRHVDRSDWIDDYIFQRVERLQHLCDNLIACRIAVERRHRQHHTGSPFHVRIEASIPPNKDLVATEERGGPDEAVELHAAIRSAFEALERQLKEAMERRRYDVKSAPPEELHGFVVRLFSEDGYGFLKTVNEREFYFHKNSVLHDDFDRLAIGTEVRFVWEMGEMGPQATTVQVVSKPGVRESADPKERTDVPLGWEARRTDS